MKISTSSYVLLLIINLLLRLVCGQNLCKEGSTHLKVLWQDQFPDTTTDAIKPVCDGTISVKDDGQICIDGRVSYAQMVQELGDNPPLFQPAVGTISVQGHLISGSGNVLLGTKGRYVYDFVTSYEMNGEEFEADESIVDNMLTASRGTIDKVCFDSSIREEESWYDISHKFSFLGGIDFDEIESREDDIGIWFFSNLATVVEYHTQVEAPGFFSFFSKAVLNTINFSVGFVPSFAFELVPIFAFTGLSRLVVSGPLSTVDFPNPLEAPENLGAVESAQIDVKWDTLVAAVKDGMFTTEKIPLYFNVAAKKLYATGKNYKCWGEGVTMAAIDLQGPANRGTEFDAFIENVMYPKLSKFGDVAIHFGKRSPPNSSILESALNFYETCGAEISLDIDSSECYHPICERKTTPTNFQYPDGYYIS